jgi:hypothetical protein
MVQQGMRLSGERAAAAPVLVTAQFAGLNIAFEEAGNSNSEEAGAGPFTAPSLVLETRRGPIQFAGPVLRYVMGLQLHVGIGGSTNLEVRSSEGCNSCCQFMLPADSLHVGFAVGSTSRAVDRIRGQ